MSPPWPTLADVARAFAWVALAGTFALGACGGLCVRIVGR
jgi:hypothetical protein